VTFKQIESLSAEPGALKKWLAEAARDGGLRTSAGELTSADDHRVLDR
jgi:hypothetical protein